MLFLGLPIVGITVLSAAVNYERTRSTLEGQAQSRLREYLGERSQRESQIFQLAQRNHVHLKQVLLKQLEKARSIDPDLEFDALLHPWSDGTLRNFPQSIPMEQFDTEQSASIFIGRGVTLTRQLKQEILLFKSLADRYGMAWNSSFVDTWINSSANVSNTYWKGMPWALQAPANLDINQEEFGYIAHKSQNPDRSARWTGVYYDPAAQKWMVSLVTPVDDETGKHIATFGNDIVLDDLLTRTRNEFLPSTRNVILSQTGRLILDSQETADPQKISGSRPIDRNQDPLLQNVLDHARKMTKKTETIQVIQSFNRQHLVGIAPLSGTDWYLVTLYPKQLIDQQAGSSTLPLILFAGGVLVLEIFYIYFILRNQISQPLQQLVSATQKISDNDFQLDLKTDRPDEIGDLSRSFTQMAWELEHSFAQLEQQNLTLESQVNDRTQALTQALEDLQTTQSQLIQSEKMSSLGQMIAGIAHEINNPVSFIHGNLNPAKHYITDLLQHLHLYKTQAQAEDIEAHGEEIDLEFLMMDLPKLLGSMQIGTDRIRAIVLSLRNFSRLDEADLKTVMVHDGIDSTLLILNHRFNLSHPKFLRGIHLEKHYGDLGAIDCFPSQLNQVIMNLLSNSIDALEALTTAPPTPNWTPTIVITTTQQEETIQIRIQDNGSGIPEEIQSRIFDPFFTTKSIGQGTGLGLSISHQIITVKHHGTIVCHSTPGEGTQFTITLPIHHLSDGHFATQRSTLERRLEPTQV
jgi:two-component system, NtrC family, sensor kinase